jgi:LPXTG-site transpeptidase (sortase) family protein
MGERMGWMRKTGVSLVAGGVTLCAAGVGTAAYGRVMARIEVARFHAQGGAAALWDGKRILAYEKSLHLNAAPALAVLRVPAVGIEAPVLEGTSDDAMNRGVGHIDGSALPGEVGNVGIAGHRDGFFRALKDVKVGDVLELERPAGAGIERDQYKVERISVVGCKCAEAIERRNADAGNVLPVLFCGIGAGEICGASEVDSRLRRER